MREVVTATQSDGLMGVTSSRPVCTVQFISFVQFLNNQNKSIQTSMPRVGLESTIPAFERATVIGARSVNISIMGF
jgi:hypothetical protein